MFFVYYVAVRGYDLDISVIIKLITLLFIENTHAMKR